MINERHIDVQTFVKLKFIYMKLRAVQKMYRIILILLSLIWIWKIKNVTSTRLTSLKISYDIHFSPSLQKLALAWLEFFYVHFSELKNKYSIYITILFRLLSENQ